MTLDNGPNYKEKIYNDIRLKYAVDKRTNKFLNYAEAKCVIEIPKVINPNIVNNFTILKQEEEEAKNHTTNESNFEKSKKSV